jgi:hypothetical protein
MPPLAYPPTGILEPDGKESEVVRHRLPRPEALEDLERDFWQLAKMPVDDLHVRNPGVQSGEVVL